jgi:hypothetical protein
MQELNNPTASQPAASVTQLPAAATRRSSRAPAPDAVYLWNGVIKQGDKYIKAQKLFRHTATVYIETDCVFFMNSEDVRVPNMNGTLGASDICKMYKMLENEIELLKLRVCVPLGLE